jgi:DNA-binding NarL/FixJ family response regulator
MPVIEVAVVEDNDEIREGLAALISGSPGFRCTGTFRTGEKALEALTTMPPHVVLMDIGLPGISGIECARQLKARSPATQIMMQTVYEDDDRIYDSLTAGATGYVLKKTPPAKLLEAIQDLHNGGSPMSGSIARRVVETFRAQSAEGSGTELLSNREHEILSLLAKGYRYKEIADQLFISVETVRTHLRNVYEKLQVRSRTEAVLKFLRK